ncbi:MAG: DUF72 domain-containing protein [Bacteroidota bacterium]|nr:DUF72 domain-containing protein [Bacteroidota bacterium]MDP4250203.1 DUF72 domain-containing protein [Bacteroidota bacterium]
MKYYIGCSGFSYKEWKGEFYPEKLPQKGWFAFYATQFNTLELNTTFYRFPTPAMLGNWFDQSPDVFLFSVKAPRLITHYKKFQDTEGLLQDFYGTVSEGLKDKLGPVLFQLPKQLVYSPELLERIIGSLDKKFLNAVEFRDPGWWTNHVEAALADHKIMFCGISHPSLPDNIVLNTTNVYYRYHGVPKLYYSEYDLDIMKAMAEKLQSPAVAHAYIYFNNTAKGAAIHNARQLKELIFAS